MAGSARRAPAARAAVGAVVAAVVATGLLGFGSAQAEPQVTAPDVDPAPVLTSPAPPTERPPASRERTERREAPASRNSADSSDSAADDDSPGRLRAAAPQPPQQDSEPADPPADPPSDPPADASEDAQAQPTAQMPQPAPPPGPPALVPGTPCTATARACVALRERTAWLIDRGTVVRGPVRIQHGDRADPTPRGTFAVQWKAEQYTSREYLTQMPYSVFFADGGIAFHEGAQDTPSAGCVKLINEDAKAFFYYLQVGDEVQIH
jgi:lipoprotein-anchoring transpeptidase ErfK/SrfK